MKSLPKNWPKIRERTVRYQAQTGTVQKTYWTVDKGMVDGKRKVLTFSTREEAEAEAKRIRSQHTKIGHDALRMGEAQLRDAAEARRKLPESATLLEAITYYTQIPPPSRQDVLEALRLMGEHGSLSGAVDFFLAHKPGEGGEKKLRELVEEYIRSRETANRRPDHLRSIRQRLAGFTETFGGILAHQVTTADIERWLDAKKNSGPIDRRNYRTVVVALFNYAKKRQYVQTNPAAVIEVPKIEAGKRPHILKPEEAENLLRYTQEHEAAMIPYLALCMFAGIRPSEVQRLEWRDIDLDKRSIYISGKVSKTKTERFVEVSANLLEWLLPYRQESNTVFFSRVRFDRIRRKTAIPWAEDCLRHSFGSYHLAMYDNAGKTALQMGHRTVDTLFEHYRRAVQKKDAEAFWSIKPTAEANVIAFPVAAAG